MPAAAPGRDDDKNGKLTGMARGLLGEGGGKHLSYRQRMLDWLVQWAGNVPNGREGLRELLIRAELIQGGKIGPAV